jgi:hypothetical protein
LVDLVFFIYCGTWAIENKLIPGGGVFNFMFFLVSVIIEIGKEAPFKFIASDQSLKLNIGVLVDRLMT